MSAVLKQQDGFEPMADEDLAAVLEIERRIYEYPWTLGNFADSMRAGYDCWVYRGGDADGGALLGYAIAAVAAGEAHLLNLSIDERVQRRGYGAQLLTHVIAAVRQKRTAMLFLEVRPSNEAARRLYRRFGFRRIGVRRDYYPAAQGREDAWVLALIL